MRDRRGERGESEARGGERRRGLESEQRERRKEKRGEEGTEGS